MVHNEMIEKLKNDSIKDEELLDCLNSKNINIVGLAIYKIIDRKYCDEYIIKALSKIAPMLSGYKVMGPYQMGHLAIASLFLVENESGYTYKEEYSDKQLNTLLNYWYFFDEKEKEIQELSEVSLETILYRKYYWCTQFKNRFNELYGKDAGIDQQQFKIIEEMNQRINDINWSLIQMIEEGKTIALDSGVTKEILVFSTHGSEINRKEM